MLCKLSISDLCKPSVFLQVWFLMGQGSLHRCHTLIPTRLINLISYISNMLIHRILCWSHHWSSSTILANVIFINVLYMKGKDILSNYAIWNIGMRDIIIRVNHPIMFCDFIFAKSFLRFQIVASTASMLEEPERVDWGTKHTKKDKM